MGAGVSNRRFGFKARNVCATLFAVGFALQCLIAGQAKAIEQFEKTTTPFWKIDEFRGGFFKQAVDDAPHEGGPAVNLEALFGRLPGGYENKVLDFFLTPRPHVGTTIAFGKTDEFYFGATWDMKLFDRAFLEASFGGAAHDGPLATPNEASYGCTLNFRESGSAWFCAFAGLEIALYGRSHVASGALPA